MPVRKSRNALNFGFTSSALPLAFRKIVNAPSSSARLFASVQIFLNV
ncbi:MAG: hypothetical protein IJP48_06675 [Synergistaceae bacterium]|nr:hypothetical protein [Synergistaceae bacterium]